MKNAFFSVINLDTVYANVALPVISCVVSYTTQRAKKGQQFTDSVISNPNTSPPHLFPTGGYLTSIKILLVDQAEIWAESTPQVAEILYKAPDATRDYVTTLHLILRLQYPGRAVESTNLNVDAEISKLSQQANENLGTYYERDNSLLIQAGSRD